MNSQSPESQALRESLESNLDQALTALGSSDRELIVLRFLKNYSIPRLSEALGITENTASKRIGRAIEKLRKYFRRRGVDLGTDALGGAIFAAAIHPAPATLGAHIISASTTAVPTVASNLTLGVFLMTASTKLLVMIVATALVLLLLGVGYAQLRHSGPASTQASAGIHAGAGQAPLVTFFSDGSAVELLAINNAADPTRWWSPDGSAISKGFAGADFSGLKDPYGETRKTCQFALRFLKIINNPGSIYLDDGGGPRTASTLRLQPDPKDPSLFFGPAVLYPQEVETGFWIEFSTLSWNKLTLDPAGKLQTPLPANLSPNQNYLPHLFIPMPVSRVTEKDGKSLLDVGMEIWAGFEFTAAAIANDGSSHPSSNLMTGLITDGDHWKLAFDLLPKDIQRFEISIRQFDQVTHFAHVSVQLDHATHPQAMGIKSSPIHFDRALYNDLFNRDLGTAIQAGNIAAAADAATKLIAEVESRRTRLNEKQSPYAYLIDAVLPILNQLEDALKQNNLEAAKALLQADSRSGSYLKYGLQRIAQEPRGRD